MSEEIRLLIIGDIFGRPGRRILQALLPGLRKEFNTHMVIANGENAAGGMGITQGVAREIFNAGVDVITTGNHVWKQQKEAVALLANESRVLRPANYPPEAPGSGLYVHTLNDGTKVAVINLCGRTFMEPLECPFHKAEELVEEARSQTPIIVVDFHAEATSEKLAMGWFLDGKVSAVVGTHTHVQTADERILPGGTAYITDIGMTGPRDGIIGVKKECIIRRFVTQIPVRFEVASGPAMLNAVLIGVDKETGKARSIKRIWREGEGLEK